MSDESASAYGGARVLVAGGAGFVGSHLVEALVRGGAQVVVVDDGSTGRWQNLSGVDEGELTAIEADICAADWPGGSLDFVFNLASPASPEAFGRMPLHTLRTGSVGTDRLLGLAAERGAVFVQASTSEVYGEPLEHPQHEGYFGNVDPMGPRSMYDEAKRFSEALCAAWSQRGVGVRVARIFNTYGPRMQPDDGRVVSNFLAQARAGSPLTVYGDGQQTRSFCYVDDLVEGLLRLGLRPCEGPVNLGNPTEVTVLELARLVLQLTGSPSELVHRPLPPGDPVRRRPDIGRARRELGWEPVVGLREGLERILRA